MSSTNANNFELNKGDQFIVALDISGSMQTNDCPGGASRFDYTLETMKAFIASAAEWDPDGVSFYAYNHALYPYVDVKSVDEINNTIAKLRPAGNTYTHLPITAAYNEHKQKGSEQTFLILFTDGAPSMPDEVKKAIVNITKDVKDEKEFRISILTVGVRTPELDKWLTDLDEHLTDAKYDIVDINKLENVDFMSAVANAIEGHH